MHEQDEEREKQGQRNCDEAGPGTNNTRLRCAETSNPVFSFSQRRSTQQFGKTQFGSESAPKRITHRRRGKCKRKKREIACTSAREKQRIQ